MCNHCKKERGLKIYIGEKYCDSCYCAIMKTKRRTNYQMQEQLDMVRTGKTGIESPRGDSLSTKVMEREQIKVMEKEQIKEKNEPERCEIEGSSSKIQKEEEIVRGNESGSTSTGGSLTEQLEKINESNEMKSPREIIKNGKKKKTTQVHCQILKEKVQVAAQSVLGVKNPETTVVQLVQELQQNQLD